MSPCHAMVEEGNLVGRPGRDSYLYKIILQKSMSKFKLYPQCCTLTPSPTFLGHVSLAWWWYVALIELFSHGIYMYESKSTFLLDFSSKSDVFCQTKLEDAVQGRIYFPTKV